MLKILFILSFVAVGFLPVYYLYFKAPPPLPNLDLDKWWGAGEPKEDTSIRPFKIKFNQDLIKDLRDRLKNRRPFTPPLEGVGFEYGFNTKTLETWVQYWQEKYDFAAREKFLNQYPHFKTKIQGLDIHFIRVTPTVPDNVKLVPLLLLHGWPGSVREFYESIPYLTAVSKDRDFALELIIPSLPGYGYSEGAVRPGMGPPEIAVIMRNLMHRLGFRKYYIQGGDWGSVITSNLATFFPEDILGYHTNMVFIMSPAVNIVTLLGSIYPPLVVDKEHESRMYPMLNVLSNNLEESGYLHIQATKPDTVGVGLLDSPSGLLAYIVEKFSTWTHSANRRLVDGGLELKFTKDQILDNLMFYWSTRSIVTSQRLYSECFNKRYMSMSLDEIPSPVPTWVLQSKHELAYLPPFLIRQKYPNLVGSPTIGDGGHFLAFELPKEFSEDVLTAIKSFRNWHKENNIKTEL